MLADYLYEQVLVQFGFVPTDDQKKTLLALCQFSLSTDNDQLLLIKGYAGTGKTSLIGAFVQVILSMQQKVVLLAPTGRAAKVFSGYAKMKAFTIHKKIYRQKKFSHEPSGFVQAENLHKNTLFIVDEASMIANSSMGGGGFGSGYLLDDLIHYIYSGENCRLVLLGDTAQLPPVTYTESPALSKSQLSSYGLQVHEALLTQIVRQTADSGILYNATHIRDTLRLGKHTLYPKIRFAGFEDIRNIPGDELIEQISDTYNKSGLDETIVICRSNKRASIYNNGIRNRVLYREEELSSGDLLMVVKNNYYWKKDEKNADFIANGEMLKVLRINKVVEFYGFRFADILAYFPDTEEEMEVKVILDTLQSETASLSREDQEKLFQGIMEDYPEETTKSGLMKRIKNDPYFNALQVKFGYAITCHKAQGGQWESVFLDIGYVSEEMLGEDFYRWIYTAFTRASQKLFIVNTAAEFIAD